MTWLTVDDFDSCYNQLPSTITASLLLDSFTIMSTFLLNDRRQLARVPSCQFSWAWAKLSNIDQTLASQLWKNLSLKFGPDFSNWVSLARAAATITTSPWDGPRQLVHQSNLYKWSKWVTDWQGYKAMIGRGLDKNHNYHFAGGSLTMWSPKSRQASTRNT